MIVTQGTSGLRYRLFVGLSDCRLAAGAPAGDGGTAGECTATQPRTQVADGHHRQLHSTRVPGQLVT